MEAEDFLVSQGVELKHHGVKGMKWGVRRKKRKSVKKGLKTRARNSEARYKKNVEEGRAAKKAGKKLTPEQNKALARRKFEREQKIGNAVAAATIVGWTGYRNRKLIMEGLRMGAVSVARSRQAREGAKMTADILKEVGSHRTAGLTLVDGVWKLVNN